MKTILVCGGRDFDNWSMLYHALHSFLINSTETTIITGGAKGADWLARAFAKYWSFKYKEYPADWKTHGKAAGHIRNKQMLDEEDVDLVIAFPGGKGTANMVKQAKERGIEVMEVEYNENDT